MPDATRMLEITPIPWLSLILWVLIALAVLYIARRPFHQVIKAISQLIYNSMRLSATALKMGCHQMETLNREVLFADGSKQAERQAERELDRISETVQRKLSAYPKLERQIMEHLSTMKDDFQKSAEIPQDLPNWVNVINAIAAIQPAGDPMAQKVLKDIHHTLKDQYKITLEGHRKAMSTRHGILSRMLPRWNSTEKRLKQLQRAIAQLSAQSAVVDRCMAALDAIRSREDGTEQRLIFSSVTRFLTASLLLGVFAVGTIINFNLIALPMSEIFGGYRYMAGFATSDIAGVVMAGLQVVLGIFLLDAARVTHLFGSISSLNHKKRTWFFWGVLVMLTILAGLESSMAFIRDRVTSDMQALELSLTGMDPVPTAAPNIFVISQMILGFILPWILATAAVPIESVIRSSRTLLGMGCVGALRMLIFLLRLAGNLGRQAGRAAVRIYDLIIFPAIWLEDLVHRRLEAQKDQPNTAKIHLVGQESTSNRLKETVVCEKTSD